MERLIDNFARIREIYEELLTLTDAKRETIVKMKIEELERIVKREQTLIASVNRLERERLELLRVLFPQARGKLSFHDVAALAGEAAAARLRPIYDALLATVRRLEEKNKQNRDILNKAVELVDFHINIFSGAMVDPIYGAPQGKGQNVISRKIFDRTV